MPLCSHFRQNAQTKIKDSGARAQMQSSVRVNSLKTVTYKLLTHLHLEKCISPQLLTHSVTITKILCRPLPCFLCILYLWSSDFKFKTNQTKLSISFFFTQCLHNKVPFPVQQKWWKTVFCFPGALLPFYKIFLPYSHCPLMF